MPSTRLTDCVPWLATAWLEVEEEYQRTRPGHALLLTCTHRSRDEQFALFQKGRCRAMDGTWVLDDDPTTAVVTYCDGVTKASKHNRLPAEAVDFCVVIAGKASWDPREYEPVGLLAEKRGLVWGGRWKMKDYPHLETP